MPKAKHYNVEGKLLGDVELPEPAFGVRPNHHVVWESVRSYRANQRQGTVATKTRSKMRGSGRKPWRQKGTGRARAGTRRSPLWVGGATVFGPQPRKYTTNLSRKIRRLALVSALSQRAQEGNVAVVDGFTFDQPRTKTVVGFMKAVGMDGKKICFIIKGSDPATVKSCRNIPRVEILTQSNMNVYDLVNADVLVFTTEALDGVKEAYGA
jgi:large subunit ribosomal protein L4